MSSSHTIGGLILGLALGAGGLYAAQTFALDAGECGGVCREGTRCEDGGCVVALDVPDEAAGETEGEPDEGRKGKRRGRRGRRGAKGGDAPAAAAGGGPPIDDDGHVPRFDANADQSISMSDGSGRLSDAQINRELAKLDPAFNACITAAAARVDELGTGKVSYSFGVDGKGKVTGVNASAPANLRDAGVIPCVRKAIHGHRFPAFDGPTMKVKSSFRVD